MKRLFLILLAGLSIISKDAIPASTDSNGAASSFDETNRTLTVDGVIYSNVVFGIVTPSSVSFRHRTGAASVLLEKLSPDLQQRFGYNKTKADEYKRKEAIQEAEYIRQRNQNWEQASKQRERQRIIDEMKSKALDARGKVLQILSDGVLATDLEIKVPQETTETSITRDYQPGVFAQRTFTKTILVYQSTSSLGDVIFVLGAGGDFADGETWESVIYPAGTYQYVSTSGSQKTVRCFTLSAERALKRLGKLTD